MRSAISNALKSLFSAEMARRFPAFHHCAGSREVWCAEAGPELMFHVFLHPFDNQDKFTVEVAWNSSPEFPWQVLPVTKLETVDSPVYRIRLPRLYSNDAIENVWAVVPDETPEERRARYAALKKGDMDGYHRKMATEDALKRLPSLVQDSIEKLEKYAIPLFLRVAESHGVTWHPSAQPARGQKG